MVVELGDLAIVLAKPNRTTHGLSSDSALYRYVCTQTWTIVLEETVRRPTKMAPAGVGPLSCFCTKALLEEGGCIAQEGVHTGGLLANHEGALELRKTWLNMIAKYPKIPC